MAFRRPDTESGCPGHVSVGRRPRSPGKDRIASTKSIAAVAHAAASRRSARPPRSSSLIAELLLVRGRQLASWPIGASDAFASLPVWRVRPVDWESRLVILVPPQRIWSSYGNLYGTSGQLRATAARLAGSIESWILLVAGQGCESLLVGSGAGAGRLQRRRWHFCVM